MQTYKVKTEAIILRALIILLIQQLIEEYTISAYDLYKCINNIISTKSIIFF